VTQDATTAVAAADPAAPLLTALAQFITVYPAIQCDLQAYLQPIDANTTTASPGFTAAQDAGDAFKQIVSGLAQAYAQWANSSAVLAVAGPGAVTMALEIALTPGETTGDAIINVVLFDGPAELVPTVHILPDQYQAVAAIGITPPPPNTIASYKCQSLADSWEFLPYQAALDTG
jgi:hypothetical protein